MNPDPHRRRVALTPASLDVPLFVGQDSSMDPRVLQPNSSAVVENGRLFNRGQVRKRYGFTAQPTQRFDGSAISTGQQVFSGGSVLFQHDGAFFNVYSYAAQRWKKLNPACGGQLTLLGAVQTNQSVSQVSSAANANYEVVLWTEGTSPGALYYIVIDLQSGAQIVPKTLISPMAQAPNVLLLNNNFYLFWGERFSGPAIEMAVILSASPASPLVRSALPVVPSINTQYDVMITPNGNLLFASEDESRGSTQTTVVLSVYYITSTGAATFLSTLTGSSPSASTPSVFQVPDDGSGLVLGAVLVNNTATVFKTTGVFTTLTFPQTADGTLVARATSSGSTLFLVTASGGGSKTCVAPSTITYSGGYVIKQNIATPLTEVFSAGINITSRGFAGPNGAYVWCVIDASYQSLAFLMDSNGGVVAISGENGAAAGYDGAGNSLAFIANDGAGNFVQALRVVKTVQITSTGPVISAVGISSQNLSLALPRTYAQQVNGVTYIANCAPQIYDGAAQTEWGFYFYPVINTVTGSSGGQLTGGVYQVAACFSWYDATGKLWRSPTSLIQSVTVPANGLIQVNVNNLWFTNKTGINIEIYCTANIGGQTGTVHYQVAALPNIAPLFTGLANLTSGNAPTQNYTINVPDTQIATGVTLYTDGGVPSYLTPPSQVHMSTSGLRLYGSCGEDNQVYVTTPATPGQPLNFVLSQSVAVEPGYGPLAAAQPMDGNLWIATPDAWFVTNADTNALNTPVVTFNPPAKAAFGDGCISSPSVLASADGIYFQSHRGIELLSRTQQAVFSGEPVKNVSGQVIDAYAVPSQQQLRFVTSGLQLCYDYERKTWLQHVFASAPVLQSGCRWNEFGVLGTTDGKVRLESPKVFFDDATTAITMRIQTPWLRLSSLMGWGKAWEFVILGEQTSAHTLQVQIAYNDDPTWIDTLSIASTAAYGSAAFGGGLGAYGKLTGAVPAGTPPSAFGINPAGNAYKFIGLIPRADGQSFKFEITNQNSTGEDFVLNYITLIYGLFPAGVIQTPTSRKFG